MYTQDVKLPGMLVAVIIAPPLFGATVKGVDATAAKAMPGVSDVVSLQAHRARRRRGMAKDYWSAKKAREAVKVVLGREQRLQARQHKIWPSTGSSPANRAEAHKEGDAARPMRRARWRPSMSSPSLPTRDGAMNCVAHVSANGCEMWTGEQFQTMDQGRGAALLGIKPEQVKINTLFAGGSFGRRCKP